MALADNELFSSAPGNQRSRTTAHRIAVKEFAAGSGTLEPNAPVAYNTVSGKWAPWTQAGANGEDLLKGLVWPDAIELDAGGEVLGQVLLEGIVHADDVKAATSEADIDVENELKEEARLLGIHVQGLQGVR